MPHEQRSQNAPPALQEDLFRRAAALSHVRVGRSHVSVPGARAFHLDPAHARGPPDARMVDTEFAHLHPAHDGSLHLTLPPTLAADAIAAGWAVPHPIAMLRGQAGLVLVFGPRDAEELETVYNLVMASYDYALGEG